MSYDFARERDEASLCAELDDLRYELEQDALDEERAVTSPYRCTDRMCGALDCSNCYPGCYAEPRPDLDDALDENWDASPQPEEPPSQDELDDVADLERNEEQ